MSVSAASRPALVTTTRSVDRDALGALGQAVEDALRPGVRHGTAVGIVIADAVSFTAALYAARRLGAEAFLIPPGTAPTRVAELCELERAALVLCDDGAESALPGRSRPCGPGLVAVELPGGMSAPAPPMHDEGTVHFFSSGSEGRPKGVVRTHASLDAEAVAVGSRLGLSEDSVVLCTVSLSHGFAFTGGLSAPIAFGGTSVVVQPRLPASLARAIETYRPDIVYAVPAQYAAWAAVRELPAGPLPRLWLSSGAPLAAGIRDRFEDAWGATISEQYGMTECGAATVDLEGSATVGRSYPGVTVSIEGADEEGVGDIIVKTAHGPCCYVGAGSAAHAEPFAANGFRSGDRGRLDSAGALHIVGRRTNQLNVRGRKVDPGEVERALWTVDGIRDVAVVGVPRADGDDWVAAFVVCESSVTDEELTAATAALEPYKRPQRVVRLPTMPQTSGGKTDPAALRALLAAPNQGAAGPT